MKVGLSNLDILVIIDIIKNDNKFDRNTVVNFTKTMDLDTVVIMVNNIVRFRITDGTIYFVGGRLSWSEVKDTKDWGDNVVVGECDEYESLSYKIKDLEKITPKETNTKEVKSRKVSQDKIINTLRGSW